MRHIFLNLKRFDIPKEYGGVNSVAPMEEWGSFIISSTQGELMRYRQEAVEFVMYFPEAHLIQAAAALCEDSPVSVGCQGVYRDDTETGGNFGAFTTNRTANAVKAMGCRSVIIGHCEERRDKAGIMAEAGLRDGTAVGRLLNREVKAAVQAGLQVLYCVGETDEEQGHWKQVLKEQLETGLEGADKSRVVIAYEPIWAIGPGKTMPDAEYINKVGACIKDITGGMDVVYGGGLKADNARMLAEIPEMDGALIALTRFRGEIGFYPEEYLDIVRTYLEHVKEKSV